MNAARIDQARGAKIKLWLARLGWAVVCVLVAGVYAANLPYFYADTRSDWLVGEALPAAMRIFPSYFAYIRTVAALRLLSAAVFVGMALFLAWRKPSDRFVLFVSATMILFSLLAANEADLSKLRFPGWLTPVQPAVSVLLPSLMILSLTLLFYLFPDGRFYPRWAAVIPVAVVIVASLALLFQDALGRVVQPLLGSGWEYYIFFFTFAITIVVGLTGQILRYRRTGSRVQRQQTKWVLFGLASVLFSLLGGGLLDLLAGRLLNYAARQLLLLLLTATVPAVLPLTIAISALRYRLWDVDLLIHRTLVYTLLTGALLVVYLGIVLVLQEVVRAFLVSSTSPVVVVVSTLVVAALFNPLRVRIQAFIDRRFYRQKYDAEQVLGEFSATLRDEVDLEVLAGLILGVVDATMQPAKLGIWMRKQGDPRIPANPHE